MGKIIIDQVRMNVTPEQEETFIKEIKEFRDDLKANDLMPMHFKLFKDIDKEINTFIIQMIFENDAAFDVWEAKLKAMPDYEERMANSVLRKYFVSYLYMEKICLDEDCEK